MNRVLCVVAAMGIGLALGAGGVHAGPDEATTPHGGDHAAASEATRAFMDAMDKMDRDMTAAPMSGVADEDFARMMIPHHQGAIDMAKVLLEHGDDPELRKLATRIVESQTKEIAEMERWLEEHADTREQNP